MTPAEMDAARTELEAVIEANAKSLGAPVEIGVHYLRDGRVRVYDLALGWRRRPFREYVSLDRALSAARTARARTQEVERLIAAGQPVSAAVSAVTATDR